MHLRLPGCIRQTGPYWRGSQDYDGSDTRGWVLEATIVVENVVVQGRLGEIEEIANLATYLCSDYARWPFCLIHLNLTLFDMGSWINAETVTLDGGEFRMLAGEFNKLRKVLLFAWHVMILFLPFLFVFCCDYVLAFVWRLFFSDAVVKMPFQVTPEQWDMMEQMIRSTNKKSKSKM